jgi:tetratricopeptide (TPR) repeat protein
MRTRIAATLCAWLLVVGIGRSQTPSAPGPTPPRFSTYDAAAQSFLSRGQRAKEAARRLAADPEAADVPGLLIAERRFDDALNAIRRIIEKHPDRLVDAFHADVTRMRDDSTRNYPAEVLPLVAAARLTLPGLPREQAAALARSLLTVEWSSRDHPRDAWPAALRAFVTEYAGTDAALLAEVELIRQLPLTAARFDELEAFAARHPGTVAAARAIFEHGWDLAVNISAFRPSRPRNDPASRLGEVLTIARRLETGAFPPCEWVRRAPEFVIEFSSFGATYSSPEQVTAMLDFYEDFVRRELARQPRERLADSSLAFVINSKMGDLFELRGDRIGGIETFLASLERDAASPTEIRHARAMMYLRYLVEPTPDRAAVLAKATASLRAVYREKVEPFSSDALATLAAVHFFTRDYRAAVPVYEEYLATYPASTWAWLAEVRRGQALTSLDDVGGAARAFAAAAAASRTPPAARVVALAFLSDAEAELGQVKDSLRDAQSALDAWDDDFGEAYRTQATQAQLPGQAFAIPNDTTVTKAGLRVRVAELTVSAATPGGGLLEQSRRIIARGHTTQAVALLRRATAEARGTLTEGVARSELHHAQLLEALDTANVELPGHDTAAALAMLDRLTAEPIDFHVFAARVARATIESSMPDHAAAVDANMAGAFAAWRARQPLSPAPAAGSLEADVAAIRTEVFRPVGGGVYANARWNAFDWPAELPRFIIANPDLSVKLASGEAQQISLRVPLPGYDNLVFMSDAEREVLVKILTSLGGTRRRQPMRVMETPNQPAGAALDVSAFWNRYFPVRPGHWSGWELETYPTVTDITFTDAARTKAAVRVTIGYSGGTVLLEKVGGAWHAREIVGLWIT